MYRPRDDNRIKLVHVPPAVIARVFDAASVPIDSITLPVFANLPKGYAVENVLYEPYRNGFTFVVYHPSWPVVKEGESAEFIEVTYQYVDLPRKVIYANETQPQTQAS